MEITKIPIEEIICKNHRFEVDDKIKTYDKNWVCLITNELYAVFARRNEEWMHTDLHDLMLLYNHKSFTKVNPLDDNFIYEFIPKHINIPHSEEKIWEPINVDVNQVLNEII